ncbi:hypothetical protein AAE478_003981 [Parahypoxylon ruwenzoriense]
MSIPAKQIGLIRKAWYQWKALRLPWRKRFLVGLDLRGNTYWEFRLARGDDAATATGQRYRRIVKYPRSTHYSDVSVPPQWHQWLRYQRERAPTLVEQASDVTRQERIKMLAAEADARWASKPSYLSAPNVPRKGEESEPVPPPGTSKVQPQKQAARESPTRNEQGPETQQTGISTTKDTDDPWKRARGAPGETWQPEVWTPTSARKR